MVPMGSTLMGESDDDALIAAAQIDQANFDALYRRYQPRVYLYLRAQISNDQDAADITQQVFVEALRGLPTLRRQSSFRAWLFTIARHTLANFRRHHPTVSWDDLPESALPHDERTPESQWLQHESLQRLAELLAKLDGDKRELLALRFAAQLPIGKIAEIVGKSPDAVRMQLSRIIHHLKEHYDAIS